MPRLLMMLLLAGMSANAAWAAGGPVTVELKALNNSGQTGTAVLSPEGSKKTKVVIEMSGISAGMVEPVHIHMGTCDKLNPAPKWPLQSIKDGRSTTIVPVSLGTILKDKTAINVHKSPTDIVTYVSCGDIVGAK